MIDSLKENIVQGFVEEACDILNFDKAYIRILYVPHVEAIRGIPQFSVITPDGCLIIDESRLGQEIENETPTRVRFDIYCKVRMLFQQSRCQGVFDQYGSEAIEDAMVFGFAVETVKGLMLPNHLSSMMQNLLDRTKNILKDEFGLNTEYYQVPNKYVGSGNFVKFRLTDDNEKEYNNRYYKESAKSTVRIIDPSEKGSELNPFNDVNEAFEYIRELEKNAYENDSLLKDIASQQFFYDLNSHQFRISWASPYVAFYNDPNIPSDGFVVNQNQPHLDGKFYFTLKPNLQRKKFLYRGQSQDYPKPCTPSMFRDETKSYFLDVLIWSQEMELLLKTHPLVKLLEQGVEIMHDHFSILMNLEGLAQHYYHKTRYLDLTSDVDAAKFFATTNYDNKKDEYSPVRDSDKLGLIYCYELQMPGAFARHEGYDLSVIGKQVFMRSGAQHGFLLGMDKGMDLKKMPQVKKFYFRHVPSISEEIFKQSDYGKKYFSTDILEEAWKTEYKQRLDNNIVSADTVRLNVTRNEGETFDSICQKLKESNITVDASYHPSFSQDLLDKYYQSIKDGWWEEFCSDIYFYGGDAALYKDCLMRIPQRDEYKWAFEKLVNKR